MASDWEGVSIAFDDTMFVASPTWTRIDSEASLVASIEIRRGRQDEFERTDTGTATIILNDTEGLFDPTNVGSPYYGNLDSKPIAIAIRNPVTDEWFPLFRGVIDEYGYDLHPSQLVTQTAIQCVDALDYFAGFELAPGLAGDTPPAGSERYVFYEDTAGLVDDRIFQVLGDASWPTALASIFSGNVHMQESTYSPGESILTVLHDCADAEFPTVANFFVDSEGFVCFHGRFARFDPDAPKLDPEAYERLVEAVVARAPWRPPLPPDDRIVIPGYRNLREFSAAQEAAVKAGLGGRFWTWVHWTNWRVTYENLPPDHQPGVLAEIREELSAGRLVQLLVTNWPKPELNHTVVAYGYRARPEGLALSVWDPNDPTSPGVVTKIPTR